VGSLGWRRKGGGIDKESGLKVQVAARWAEQILFKTAWMSLTAEAR
jgi:nicotinic acid phosphoribosyltransferase